LKAPQKIKVLIVDDSVLFRSQIQLALSTCAEIDIVGVASNGKIAIDRMACMEIDACILDFEMPVMDGIETLRELRIRGIKTKVIMFSAQSRAGADKTLEAMRCGAVDFVAKPLPDESNLAPADKIREALFPKLISLFSTEKPIPVIKSVPRPTVFWESFIPKVLVIASSTGGPMALETFFANLKLPLPYPILVTQHMPPVFTAALAERLGAVCGKVAHEGINGEELVPNQIYVAPGGSHMRIKLQNGSPCIDIFQGEQRNFVRPCADYLFETAAQIYGRHTLGIVFTGMGRDGATGAAEIKKNNGIVLIQSAESCVVFGMPGAVHSEKNFDYSGTPLELGDKIQTITRAKKSGYVA
jgi:two-component system chemotaxis response regulator CheB